MIILASNSPRRQQLLELAGWQFKVLSGEIDERPLAGEEPKDYVLRLAESKARAALSMLSVDGLNDTLIVAADTTVVIDGHILGKPVSSADARRMLQRLRGRTHQVYTGLGVLRVLNKNLSTKVVGTDVRMRNYTDAEIGNYIDSGDPLDKAGAYAIQHRGFHPVKSVQGCYANVVGLPLCWLEQMMAEQGKHPQRQPILECPGTGEQACTLGEYFEQLGSSQ
jgi:septum formation protein